MTSDRPYRERAPARRGDRGAAPARRHAVRPARRRGAARDWSGGRPARLPRGYATPHALLIAAARRALSSPGPAAAPPSKPSYYVSLGDSYAAGYQRHWPGTGQVHPQRASPTSSSARPSERGYNLKLVNFGCGGETIVLDPQAQGDVRRASAPAARSTPAAPRRRPPRSSSAQAPRPGRADHRLDRRQRRHRAARARPTRSPASAPPWRRSRPTARSSSRGCARRQATKTRIVGITYPDVILGGWVGENPDQDLAKLSVVAFQYAAQPGAEGDLQVGQGHASSTSRRPPAPTRRSSRRRPRALRRDPGRGRRDLQAHVLLRVPRHPREHEGLRRHRRPDREDAAAQALMSRARGRPLPLRGGGLRRLALPAGRRDRTGAARDPRPRARGRARDAPGRLRGALRRRRLRSARVHLPPLRRLRRRPRQLLDIRRQLDDWRAALRFGRALRRHPGSRDRALGLLVRRRPRTRDRRERGRGSPRSWASARSPTAWPRCGAADQKVAARLTVLALRDELAARTAGRPCACPSPARPARPR